MRMGTHFGLTLYSWGMGGVYRPEMGGVTRPVPFGVTRPVVARDPGPGLRAPLPGGCLVVGFVRSLRAMRKG